MFYCEIYEIFKNTYSEEHLRTTASWSGYSILIPQFWFMAKTMRLKILQYFKLSDQKWKIYSLGMKIFIKHKRLYNFIVTI